ncbi:MAG: RNA polymerase sporulation sigma factor SigK [Defluviitaleaceae bacterium]|nr:RNA polymerase sporulation sigma factor SigK [Defluviitaleaceae bacterium]
MFFGLLHLLQGFFFLGYLSGGNSFPTPLSAEDEHKYLLEYAEGNEDAKNILIERNLRLVAHVAKKYSNHSKDSEDLISVGTIGLIKAITSYKPDKGTRLATYAARCIDNEILMHIRAAKKYSGDVYLQDIVGMDREGNEVRIEDKIADDTDPVDDQVNLKMQIKRLYDVIHRVLHGREKTVIELRYGLAAIDEMTQREIATMLDISRSYVSRIEKKALGKLGKEMDEPAEA